MTVQSSRKTTTMTSTGHGGTVTSTTSEYNVRQLDSGPGGQMLDCKVDRDLQTGQPHVEMIFSMDPQQQQQQQQPPAVTPPVLTVYC